MATAPPITIGEITDVPAFNSPIASPWAQETSRRIVHRFATTAARDAAYPANTAGAGAICAVGGVLYVSDGTRWVGGYAGLVAGAQTGIPMNTGQQAVYWTAPGAAGDPLGMLDAADRRTIHIPYAGLWAVTFTITSAATPANSTPAVFTSSNGSWWGGGINAASWGTCATLKLPAGEVVQCGLYNGGAATNVTNGGVHCLQVG